MSIERILIGRPQGIFSLLERIILDISQEMEELRAQICPKTHSNIGEEICASSLASSPHCVPYTSSCVPKEDKQQDEFKKKPKNPSMKKDKKCTSIKKGKKKSNYFHFKKEGHHQDQCYCLHPKLKLKKLGMKFKR